MAALTANEILMNGSGLVVNSFRDAEGRGAYFSGSSGTSEGQFLFILGCLDAYELTGDKKALRLAERALSHVLPVLYRNMPIPSQVTSTESFAPHWLFSVKYPFSSTVIHYDGVVNFSNGVGTLGVAQVRTIFNVRSMDANYLWNNPYSALTSGQFYGIASTDIQDNSATINLSNGFSGQAIVTYSTRKGKTIAVNEPYEAWPDWRKLDTTEIEAACDVFIWAYRAFQKAHDLTGVQTWADAARATREQALIAMDLNDARDWLKPTWTDSPFADGARFKFVDRVPAPAFSVAEFGCVQIGIPSIVSGTGEVQYGKASVKDVYNDGDTTTIEIGASVPAVVTVYIDQYQQYDENNRYSHVLNLAATSVDALQSFTLTRNDFKNKNGAVLPPGSPVYVVGFTTNYSRPFTLWIKRVRQLPKLALTYYPGAIPFTANFSGNPPMLIDWRGPVYAGYQAPQMWLYSGNAQAALICTQLLADAQSAWVAQTGQPVGPFAPVYYFERSDAVQYGTPGQFGWEGPDPNTKWGGYEYRPLAELAETVWLNAQGTQLYNLSVSVANKFLDWLASVWPQNSTFIGPPTDFPMSGATTGYNEPHMAALIWRAAIKLDWKQRIINGEYTNMRASHAAITAKVEAQYDATYITTGVMAGTFSDDEANHSWYGFWHGEILSTLALAYKWCMLPEVNKPALAAKCMTWIQGLNKWATLNAGRVESKYGEYLWPFEQDWASTLTETWLFDTNIMTAFDGTEQRKANRQKPRRILTLNHTMLSQAEVAQYQGLLQARQKYPSLIPQWHLAGVTTQPLTLNGDTIYLRDALDPSIDIGSVILLASTTAQHKTWVRWIDGNEIIFNDPVTEAFPAGTRVMPCFNGQLVNTLDNTRLVAAAGQAQAKFTMLPQEDTRLLPVAAALATFSVSGDTRELMTFRPNWSDSLSITDSWTYNLVDYTDAPIDPMEGEIWGRRAVKAKFTFFNQAEVNAYLAFINRVQGRLKAFWVPSWTRDFEMVADSTDLNELRVSESSITTEAVVTKSWIGIAVRYTDGVISAARVSSVSSASGAVTLTLDRNLLRRPTQANTAIVSLLYKARLGSDQIDIEWITPQTAESTLSFMTVMQ